MDTLERNGLATISEIYNKISTGLAMSGFEILFSSETVNDGILRLSLLRELPDFCIVDLDFYDKIIIGKLTELARKYPTVKLIAHSDIDDEKMAKDILDIGFLSYFLLGSDIDDFKKVMAK